jgi:hypothetical protein
VIKCDFCMECVRVCNTNALVKWERKPDPVHTEV